MNYQEIQEALGTLARLSEELENQYIENEGEVTPEAEALEEQKAAVAGLLEGDGIDSLGRWLKAKEDEMKTWKAEKDAAARKVKSVQNTIDFIKAIISEVMKAVGTDKVKGSYYGFTAYVSEKNTVNMDELNERWLGIAEKGAREMGLPGYIDVELKTSVSKIQDWAPTHDGQGVAFLETATADAVRFTKPRAGKDA